MLKTEQNTQTVPFSTRSEAKFLEVLSVRQKVPRNLTVKWPIYRAMHIFWIIKPLEGAMNTSRFETFGLVWYRSLIWSFVLSALNS